MINILIVKNVPSRDAGFLPRHQILPTYAATSGRSITTWVLPAWVQT